ncbi:MAG: hypothetical protein QOI66_3080 [Myxococcales bacterium]|nr:hypothetical protein [Myxococcales bacterium]
MTDTDDDAWTELGLGPSEVRRGRVREPSQGSRGDERPASLAAVLTITFLGSVSGGAFWAGIFFVTAKRYGFSPTSNLLLASVMGAIYSIAALSVGRLLRALHGRVSPRGALMVTLGSWGLASLAPLLAPGSRPLLWATALAGAAASALTWPIVESYLSAGRHGARMRAAIGWFNCTWTPATAVPLLVMPLLARADVLWTIALSAPVNALAIAVIATLPRRPGAHAAASAQAAVGAEYPWLQRSAAWLLPLSYVLSSTLAPVLPHRFAVMGVGGAGSAPDSVLAAAWMVSRFVTLLLMWRTGFWHGRWGTLLSAGVALAGGMATVLLAGNLPLMMAGLVIFGAGMGLTYYSALYYSMAVGHAAVDAGGTFEALIGLGYFLGPLLGLAGHAAAGAERAAGATVTFALAVTGLASIPLLRPYLQARRRRQRRTSA